MKDRQYHHGNLRNSLIEAGIDLINEYGEKSLSLRKVAARCGVSQAAPYSHFHSKEDLMAAMRDYVTGKFMDSLENTVKSFANPEDPRLLIQIGKCYVMFFLKNPNYFPFLFSQYCMEVDLSLNTSGSRSFPPYELMKTVAVPILEKLGISGERTEDAIISMWATIHGLTSIATMQNVHYDKEWESKIEDLIWNR